MDGKKKCPKCWIDYDVADYVAHVKSHVSNSSVTLCPVDKCAAFLKANDGLIIRTNKRSDVISDSMEVGDENDDSLDGEDLISVLNQDFKRNTVSFYTQPGTKLHDDALYQIPHFRSFL